MGEIIYKKESYAIIGACFEVYNEKGCRFLEPVYQECLAIEFNISRFRQSLNRRSHSAIAAILTQTYQPDFVCFGKSSSN
jgi:GxxExxY protein